MKVVVIEDETVALEHLKSMLQETDNEISVVAALDSIESATKYFGTNPRVDLVFMDIELGDGQSFEIFKQARIDAPVIFTTAYQEHALKAFKQNSVDYLLKPVDIHELEAAIDKFRRQHGLLSLLKRVEKQGEVKTRYLAKTGTRLISVLGEDISHFYTRDRMQYIKTHKGESFAIDKRLDEIESDMDDKLFFRANRQFIVSYHSIQKVHTWFSGKLKVSVSPESYEEIIISRLRAGDFKKWLGE
ncbi:MAG: response regulator transcription factor [Gemmatimonadaceae bacterium]|nr:response regulator transcription factor [Chitinophagaceae bacterium]